MKTEYSLRKELEAIIRKACTCRPAALRRSLKEHMLYATDLPILLTEHELTEWIKEAEKKGWKTEMDGEWLLLDHEIPDTLSERYSGPFGDEAACCASLLKRKGGNVDAADVKRRLLKAGEEGARAYEKVCQDLHREWAVAMRKKEQLPAIPTDWFEKKS